MAALTLAQTATIQTYVGLVFDRIADAGLSVNVEPDLADWVDVMENAPGRSSVSPTFNPATSNVHTGNSYWLHVQRGRESVACIASRILETDDYYGLIRSGRLWYDRGLTVVNAGTRFVIPEDAPAVGGTVGHHGGLWVHPDLRKQGLSEYLPKVTRAMAIMRFETDWSTGMVKSSLAESGLVYRAYGYTHALPCTQGYYPPFGKDADFHMTLIARENELDRLAQDVLRFGGDTHH